MSYDTEKAIESIEPCKSALGELYAETVIRIRKEPNPDKREATKIAVDVSKTFMTISLAAFALIGLFARYYLSEGYALQSPKLISLGISAGCALLSMIVGLTAISAVYNSADGKSGRDSGQEYWNIDDIRGKLNAQAIIGLLSIGAFVAAVTAWNEDGRKGTRIDMLALEPGSTAESAIAVFSPPFVISGNTSSITVVGEGGTSFEWQIPDRGSDGEPNDTRSWILNLSASE